MNIETAIIYDILNQKFTKLVGLDSVNIFTSYPFEFAAAKPLLVAVLLHMD